MLCFQVVAVIVHSLQEAVNRSQSYLLKLLIVVHGMGNGDGSAQKSADPKPNRGCAMYGGFLEVNSLNCPKQLPREGTFSHPRN